MFLGAGWFAPRRPRSTEAAMVLLVDRHGQIRCLYSEALALSSLGPLAIKRGSHVEPDAAGSWWADLAPLEGPRLGPFACRSAALAAEVAWIETSWLVP